MKIDKDKVLFLLGGHDLEMQTIKEALIDEGFTEGKEFFDNALQWNTAKLTAYDDVIEANVGKNTPLKIERGVNALWSKGGIMYSPPFR